jgi:DNA-binding NarL/FixJ family response regulator
LEKITILIADDHKLIRDTWKMLLNNDPAYTVIADCSNGQECISLFEQWRPDIILMDINMEPVSGLEATERIKALSPRTRIIGVSMYAQPAFAKKMLQLGAIGYVTKNSPLDELTTAINEAHKGRQYICDEVRMLMLESKNPENSSTTPAQLSRREIEIIRFIKEGLSSKQIAEQLLISLKTVEVHRHNILKKMKLKNSAALVNYVNKTGLIL